MLRTSGTASKTSPRSLDWANFLSWPTFIVALTTGYVAAGVLALVAWRLSGNNAWIEQFFELPGALVLIALAGIELGFSLRVLGRFDKGDFMHPAWKFIAMAAGCQVVGSIASQLFGKAFGYGLLRGYSFTPPPMDAIRQFGLLMGGPCRYGLLGAGLYCALKVYRKSGFLGKLKPADWLVIAVATAYNVREARDYCIAVQAGKPVLAADIVSWLVDPILVLLLVEALLLYRSVRRMGAEGRIGRCWRTFSIAITVVCIGDMAIWATAYGYLPWPWSAVEWYIWFVAAGAFALAPAFQLEVMSALTARRGAPALPRF